MMNTDMDLTSGSNRRLARIRKAFSAWRGQARDRRALASLDDRALKDIGLTRCELSSEIARWRWRA